MGSGGSGEGDGQSASRIQPPGPLVPTLSRLDGEDVGRCGGEQLAVELVDLAALVREREVDRLLAGEDQVIGDKTIVLNGDVHRLDSRIATDREASDQQDKRGESTIQGTVGPPEDGSRGRSHG